MQVISRQYPKAPNFPPELRNGEPDMVCIGAQRAGTTRLAFLLYEHPEFHIPEYLGRILKPNQSQWMSVKERHFFDRTAFGLTDLHIEEYRKWFPRPEGTKTGEFTPRYMFDFWVAEQLKAAAPTTKLIVTLRDPVERFWSGCHFDGMDPNKYNEHFYRGLYASQLEHWYRHFDREQVLVVLYERMNKQPVESFQEICRFIGIDDTVQPSNERVDEVVNATFDKLEFPEPLRKSLIEGYRADVAKLGEMHPELDLGMWKNFRAG